MKRLETYIYEELDENIFWLLDKWFERNENQEKEFFNLIINCKSSKTVDIKQLEEWIENTQLKDNLTQFVNFIYNDVKPDQSQDPLQKLKKIIELVLSNQSKKNKYNKS